MLASQYRLKRGSDFRRVRAQGECWSNRKLVLCRCSNDLARSRFGFSVSKRVGNAVVRNRIKRLASEAVRLNSDMVAPGWDVVMIARRPIVSATYWEVEAAVIDLLAAAHIVANDPPSCEGA